MNNKTKKQKGYVDSLSRICEKHPQEFFGKNPAYIKSFGKVIYLQMKSLAIKHERKDATEESKKGNPFRNVNIKTFEPALKRLIGRELYEKLPARHKVKNGKLVFIEKEIDMLRTSRALQRRFFAFMKKVILNREINSKSIKNYVGGESVLLKAMQDATNEEILSRRTFITSKGEKKSILEVIDNGERRSCELITEMKGIEKMAESKGMIWMMVTITLAGKYHSNPKLGKNTFENGTTIDDMICEFRSNWRNMCKRIAKNEDLRFCDDNAFGIKVIEPHFDGTPHWHIAFFCKKEKIKIYQEMFLEYFAHSKKAVQFNVAGETDGAEAKASSYLFKYILKFTGGDRNESNEKTDISASAIVNVKTWRSAAQVRSFEKFGIRGAATKYRRLRNFENKKARVIIRRKEDASIEAFQAEIKAFEKIKEIATRRKMVSGQLKNDVDYFEFMSEIGKFNFPKKNEEESKGEFEVFENEILILTVEKTKINCAQKKEKKQEEQKQEIKKVIKKEIVGKIETESAADIEKRRKEKADRGFAEFLAAVEEINKIAA